MTRVELRPGEAQESLLKRFRRRVARDRVLSMVRRKRFFVPKSEKRRIARRRAVRRERRRRWRSQRRWRR